MTEAMIANLTDKGFKRWQKGNMDRMYVNAGTLGLVCTYYNTGNVRSAEFQGHDISNCEARRMKAAKTFIDVRTGKVYSDNYTLQQAVEEMLQSEEAQG